MPREGACAPLRALIFDVDGTLAETELDGHLPAFNEAFAEAGLPWRWDEATYGRWLSVTGGKERLAAWWRSVDPAAADAPGAAARVAHWHALKTTAYARRVQGGALRLRPGVRRLLTEARQRGLRLAIATTTTEANVRELLRHTMGEAGERCFEVIGAGDAVAHKKPAPDIWHWTLARLGLRPEEALAIEDSAPGVASAHAAGLPVLLTRSRWSQGQVMRAPVLADLDHLGEPASPARGVVLAEGGPPGARHAWRGMVDVATLCRWRARLSAPAAAAA